MSAETYGRRERGVERRGRDVPRRARFPPSPGRRGGLGPPCKQSDGACPRKVRNVVFGKGICASMMRSEALPCLKEDETASEERLGRAKAKPPTQPFQRQRFRAVLRIAANPDGQPCGPLPHAPESPRKTGLL